MARRNSFKHHLQALILPFLVSSVPALAQDQTTESALLWEVSGNGLSAPSYIYGTFHLIDAAHFTVSPAVDSAFAHCDQIAFEIKMDDMSMIGKTMQWMPLPNGGALSDYCTPEEYSIVSQYVKDSMGMDIVMFKGAKPLALYQSTMVANIEGESASYEMHFMEKGAAAQKPILGLETIEFQLSVFDSIPYDEQIDWIVQSIQDNTGATLWDDMIRTYTSQNIEAIYQLTIADSPELKKYEALLITDRNKRWIPVIEQYAKEKPTFVAVGAAHLGGPNGIIKLLKEAGYTLTPVK